MELLAEPPSLEKLKKLLRTALYLGYRMIEINTKMDRKLRGNCTRVQLHDYIDYLTTFNRAVMDNVEGFNVDLLRVKEECRLGGEAEVVEEAVVAATAAAAVAERETTMGTNGNARVNHKMLSLKSVETANESWSSSDDFLMGNLSTLTSLPTWQKADLIANYLNSQEPDPAEAMEDGAMEATVEATIIKPVIIKVNETVAATLPPTEALETPANDDPPAAVAAAPQLEEAAAPQLEEAAAPQLEEAAVAEVESASSATVQVIGSPPLSSACTEQLEERLNDINPDASAPDNIYDFLNQANPVEEFQLKQELKDDEEVDNLSNRSSSRTYFSPVPIKVANSDIVSEDSMANDVKQNQSECNEEDLLARLRTDDILFGNSDSASSFGSLSEDEVPTTPGKIRTTFPAFPQSEEEESNPEENESILSEPIRPLHATNPPTAVQSAPKNNAQTERQLVAMHNLWECRVTLERNYEADMLAKDLRFDELVNRVTDLSSLDRPHTKRKERKKGKKSQRKKSSAFALYDANEILSTSSSGKSDDDESDTSEASIIFAPEIPPPTTTTTTNTEDDVCLAKITAINEISSSSSTCSATSNASGRKKKSGNQESASKPQTSKEMNDAQSNDGQSNQPRKEKSSWRYDPLLTGRITIRESDSESDPVEGDNVLSERQLKKLEKTHQVDPSAGKRHRSRSVEPGGRKRTRVGSTSSDSSLEFIADLPSKKPDEDIVISSDESVIHLSSDARGRKNIRAIKSEKTLRMETQAAKQAENEKRSRIIQKHLTMSQMLSQRSTDEQSQGEGLVLDVDAKTGKPLVAVHPKITRRLKKHQHAGVSFMWDCCYESVAQLKKNDGGSGCILAHCMGLGKTFQVITLVHTLFTHPITNTRYVLVVCPLSVVLNWDAEFKKSLEGIPGEINVFCVRLHHPPLYGGANRKNKCENCTCSGKFASSFTNHESIRTGTATFFERFKHRNDRLFIINDWIQKHGVLVIGYESFNSLVKPILKGDASKQSRNITKILFNPGPDLLVVDEGHLLKKDKSLRSQCLSQITTKRRILLTGTPLQNNLQEYYFMVHFVKPDLLGSQQEFMNRFGNPIQNGQYHDSTESDIWQMKKRSHVLHKLLSGTVQRFEISELLSYLPSMLDYVIFVNLHAVQGELYTKYITEVRRDEEKAKKFFEHYQQLQLVWSHPCLLQLKHESKKKGATKQKEVDIINLDSDDPDDNASVTTIKAQEDLWFSSLIPADLQTVIDYGTKFRVTVSILRECEIAGDKVLIFCNNLLGMDALEMFLQKEQMLNGERWQPKRDYVRMDGAVAPDLRIKLCNDFNNPLNKQLKMFLISHKVGGLGLNLVAANRVILMDTSWNPAYDNQSIFRVFRFGQTKQCFVYRLIAMGTMEEVVHERSITKLGISNRVVDQVQIPRHFKSIDLAQIYRCNLPGPDEEQKLQTIPQDIMLANILRKHRKEILKYYEHKSLLQNQTEETLNEEEMKQAWDEFHKETDEHERQLQAQQMKEKIQQQLQQNNGESSTSGKRSTVANLQITSIESSDNAIDLSKYGILRSTLQTPINPEFVGTDGPSEVEIPYSADPNPYMWQQDPLAFNVNQPNTAQGVSRPDPKPAQPRKPYTRRKSTANLNMNFTPNGPRPMRATGQPISHMQNLVNQIPHPAYTIVHPGMHSGSTMSTNHGSYNAQPYNTTPAHHVHPAQLRVNQLTTETHHQQQQQPRPSPSNLVIVPDSDVSLPDVSIHAIPPTHTPVPLNLLQQQRNANQGRLAVLRDLQEGGGISITRIGPPKQRIHTPTHQD